MNLHYLYNKFVDELFDKLQVRVFVTDEFSHKYPYYLIKRVDHQKYSGYFGNVLFLDQEPIYKTFVPWLRPSAEQTQGELKDDVWADIFLGNNRPDKHFMIFVSEQSYETDLIKELATDITNHNQCVVYYFYHALASLDNYREYWKQNIQVPSSHEYLFIVYQNIVNPYRWHRIRFQQRLIESDLINQGLVSFNAPDQDSLVDIIKLATDHHKNPQAEAEALACLDQLSVKYTIDEEAPTGSMSTYIDIDTCHRALIHIVSETAFYNGKKHLTEKVFKPIVAKQPFLLLAPKGNLQYLKNYGFKTFSDFWDESYDDIEDDNQRIDAVYNILADLSKLSYEEQCQLRKDVQEIVDYNWYHFYYDLKNIVIDELTANLQTEVDNSTMWKHFIKTQDIEHLNRMLKF